jgi:hypothetical protein
MPADSPKSFERRLSWRYQEIMRSEKLAPLATAWFWCIGATTIGFVLFMIDRWFSIRIMTDIPRFICALCGLFVLAPLIVYVLGLICVGPYFAFFFTLERAGLSRGTARCISFLAQTGLLTIIHFFARGK